MKTIALGIVLSLAIGSSAYAGTKPPPSDQSCMTVAKLKTILKGATFTPLTIGQMNYVLGAYDATTPANTPLPAADNAILAKGKKGALIIWMKAECAVSSLAPMPIGSEFTAHLQAIHPVAGETSDAEDDSADMHL